MIVLDVGLKSSLMTRLQSLVLRLSPWAWAWPCPEAQILVNITAWQWFTKILRINVQIKSANLIK